MAPIPIAAIAPVKSEIPPVAIPISAPKAAILALRPVMIGPKFLIAVPACNAPCANPEKSPDFKAVAKLDNEVVQDVIEF